MTTPTIQDVLRRSHPHIFEDTNADPDYIKWRDDPEWNSPLFRRLQVLKMIVKVYNTTLGRDNETRFTIFYCQKELKPFQVVHERQIKNHYDALLKDVPRPLWVKWYETCMKVKGFMKKIDTSPLGLGKVFCVSLGSFSLLGSMIIFSPILWIATGFSGAGYWCLQRKH